MVLLHARLGLHVWVRLFPLYRGALALVGRDQRILYVGHLTAHVLKDCLPVQIVELRKQFLMELILVELVSLQVPHEVVRVEPTALGLVKPFALVFHQLARFGWAIPTFLRSFSVARAVGYGSSAASNWSERANHGSLAPIKLRP